LVQERSALIETLVALFAGDGVVTAVGAVNTVFSITLLSTALVQSDLHETLANLLNHVVCEMVNGS
jgi:hypothetical protein